MACDARTQTTRQQGINYKRCFSCGNWGHLSYSCPNKKPPASLQEKPNTKALFAGACDDVAWNKDSYKYLKRGTVDGRPVQMLVDTGADRTIVSGEVVKMARLDAHCKVPVLCVHGDVCSYPTAEVVLASGPWKKKTRVAVAPNLPVSVLLGRDAYASLITISGYVTNWNLIQTCGVWKLCPSLLSLLLFHVGPFCL